MSTFIGKDQLNTFVKEFLTEWPGEDVTAVLPDFLGGYISYGGSYPPGALTKARREELRAKVVATQLEAPEEFTHKEFAPTHIISGTNFPAHEVVIKYQSDSSVVWEDEYGDEHCRSTELIEIKPYQSAEEVTKELLLSKWCRQSLDDAYDTEDSKVMLKHVFTWLIEQDLINKDALQ